MNRELISTKKVIKIVRFKQANPNSKRITPSLYSKRKKERQLASSLYNLKHAQRYPGKNGNVFYPILEKVVEELNEPKLFSYVDRKQKAIDNLNFVLEWIKNNDNRFPKGKQKDPVEKKCNVIMRNFLATKLGKLSGVWYSELDDMIKQSPFPNYFTIEQKVISDDIEDLIKFYRKNKRTPTQLSKDPVERSLYQKMLRYKQSKAGKNVLIWNENIDKIIKRTKIRNIFV